MPQHAGNLSGVTCARQQIRQGRAVPSHRLTGGEDVEGEVGGDLLERGLRELSPCPLANPPYQPAPPEDDRAQTNPSEHADRDESGTECHHGRDHNEIIRSGVAAVRATTTPRIQNARRAHPDEGDNPDHGANGYRDKQTAKHGCER